METIRCSAILFDLDGVLLDSGAAVARAWGRWAASHGLEVDSVVAAAHGRRTRDTIRAVAPWLDVEAEVRVLEESETTDTEGVVALPGAAALLGALPAGSWTVATSGSRRLATTRLTVSGLPVPPALVTADDVERGKPDPQPYLAAAAALGVDPARCLVVEDVPAGIAAGKAAGAGVLAVTTTFAPALLDAADYVVPSLAAVQLRSAAEAGGAFELELAVDGSGSPLGEEARSGG